MLAETNTLGETMRRRLNLTLVQDAHRMARIARASGADYRASYAASARHLATLTRFERAQLRKRMKEA